MLFRSQSVVSGHAHVTLLGALNFLPQIRSGKATALAVSFPTPLLPGVATLADQGITMDVTNWFGFFVPAGTPDAAIRRIRDDVARLYDEPAFREKNLVQQGLLPVANGTEEFARSIPADMAVGAELIKLSGARPD